MKLFEKITLENQTLKNRIAMDYIHLVRNTSTAQLRIIHRSVKRTDIRLDYLIDVTTF